MAQFEIRESTEADGAIRLTLMGELDMGSASPLERRLDELKASRAQVILDLSSLEFMDSSGLRILLRETGGSGAKGGRVRIDPEISDVVRQLVELTGIDRQLWPPAAG